MVGRSKPLSGVAKKQGPPAFIKTGGLLKKLRNIIG